MVWISIWLGQLSRLAEVWTFGCSLSELFGRKTSSSFRMDSEPKSSSAQLAACRPSAWVFGHVAPIFKHICVFLLRRRPCFMQRPSFQLCVLLKLRQFSSILFISDKDLTNIIMSSHLKGCQTDRKIRKRLSAGAVNFLFDQLFARLPF